MTGTLVDAAAIVAGGIVGIVCGRILPKKYQNTIMQGLALTVGLIGLQMALKTQNPLIVVLSMAIGAVIGEIVDIDGILNKWGRQVTLKIGGQFGDVGKGFVTGTLVYCVGAMAVVGALQDGLNGDPTILYAKAVIDGISAIIFAASMGIGVCLAAVPVLIYQGAITLLAASFGHWLAESFILEMTSVGGLLIVAISLSVLDIKQIKVANLLPALPVAIILAIFWPA